MVLDENEFFRQATLRICGHLEIERAMRSCLQFIAPVVPCDSMYLDLFEEGVSANRTIAMATPSDARRLDLVTPLPVDARTYKERRSAKDVWIVNRPEKEPISEG